MVYFLPSSPSAHPSQSLGALTVQATRGRLRDGSRMAGRPSSSFWLHPSLSPIECFRVQHGCFDWLVCAAVLPCAVHIC